MNPFSSSAPVPNQSAVVSLIKILQILSGASENGALRVKFPTPIGGVWGAITGDILDQTDLTDLLMQYVGAAVVGLADNKGGIDCSTNPNYPAALKSDYYYVTVAGKIGGAAGNDVAVGSVIMAVVDSVAGDQATVGANWIIIDSGIPGVTTVGMALATIADGATVRYIRINADNTVSGLSAADLAAATGANTTKISFAASDEATALTAGTGKVTLHADEAMTITDIFVGLSTAQTSGSIFTVDINKNGGSLLGTKLTIDNAEATSLTAATPATITTTSLAKGDTITVDIDQIGDGTAKGLKVYISGTKA